MANQPGLPYQHYYKRCVKKVSIKLKTNLSVRVGTLSLLFLLKENDEVLERILTDQLECTQRRQPILLKMWTYNYRIHLQDHSKLISSYLQEVSSIILSCFKFDFKHSCQVAVSTIHWLPIYKNVETYWEYKVLLDCSSAILFTIIVALNCFWQGKLIIFLFPFPVKLYIQSLCKTGH